MPLERNQIYIRLLFAIFLIQFFLTCEYLSVVVVVV